MQAFVADVAEDEQRREILDWVEDFGEGLQHPGQQRRRQPHSQPPSTTPKTSGGEIFEINLFSAFELSRYAYPLLTQPCGVEHRQRRQRVRDDPRAHRRAPTAWRKAALHQLTRNLAVEWAEDGMRVNAVAPWYIRTRRTSDSLADPDYLDEVLLRTPMGRIGEPEEVAAAVAFLCLPAAAYVTGECIAVDGGFLRYGF